MANLEAARVEINKVVSLLVTRFGSQEEVFGHLTKALSHLRPDPVVKPPVEAEEPVATEEDWALAGANPTTAAALVDLTVDADTVDIAPFAAPKSKPKPKRTVRRTRARKRK